APRAAGVVRVQDQPAAGDAGDGDGVRAAGQLDRGLQHRVDRVADVEDVHALPAGRHRRAETGPRRGLLRVPRPDQDVAVDGDVALIAIAGRVGKLDGIAGVGDVDDPPSVVVAVEGQVPLEGDVGVDVPHPVGLALGTMGYRVAPVTAQRGAHLE